jgi:hypothetical protein
MKIFVRDKQLNYYYYYYYYYHHHHHHHHHHGLSEDTRDRDRWRNLVLGEGKPL